MFGFLKKEKNPIKLAIKRDGMAATAKRFAVEIISKIDNKKTAYQFVLEELDAASKGNDAAMRFCMQSGISISEYSGAMARSFEAVDGPAGPQQALLNVCLHLRDDIGLMVELRTTIVDIIMRHFKFGKYYVDGSVSKVKLNLVQLVEKTDESEYGEFVRINNDLGRLVEKNENLPNDVVMAYGYARRFAVAGMFCQGIVDSDLVVHVTNIFRSLQMSTDQTKEFQNNAAKDALELINDYFYDITLSLEEVGAICHSVESGIVEPRNHDFVPMPSDIIRAIRKQLNYEMEN
ncbi:hypothetical protein Q9290_00945 [Oceanimonas sp. CHS3-5]|uniref:hypothetical protein n=1 Tax=Oceanimonas sp. CHS3-5 TaxID=3068186 RepID=UPI00273E811D|nr:hypothetical protein [Oceanimonas sp. CHS3-5]MDP5290866.1 hypothetical protein [Oceanimonas sp. CHS3-5]